MDAPIALHPNTFGGRRVIVTGAAGGIGAAVCHEVAGAGAHVLALDRLFPSDTVAAVTESGGRITGSALDVTDRRACLEAIGSVDNVAAVVTSAGVYGPAKPLEEMSEAELDATWAANVKGTLWAISAALPALRREGGNIVCIGSAAGQVGAIGAGVDYAASKGALMAAVKSVARTEAKFAIVANVVAPGAVDTGMIAGRGYDGANTPLGRIATPQEIAKVVAFVASNNARYMTGTVVSVNGGLSMA